VQSIIRIANYSDGVLYALAALQLLELAVILDRAWFLRRTILFGTKLIGRVAAHGSIGPAELRGLANEAGELPEAGILAAAGEVDWHNTDKLDSRMEEAILLTAPTLDRRLWVLDTTVTLAPLLGLFGTILGMFRAFSVLGKPGTAPTAVTGGVAIALVTTAAGIFVAMVGLLAYNGLSNSVRQVVHQMETLRTLLMNRLTAPATRASLAAE
jgi:biopolymer transport protein ExbB